MDPEPGPRPKLVFGQHIGCPRCKTRGTYQGKTCYDCRGAGFITPPPPKAEP